MGVGIGAVLAASISNPPVKTAENTPLPATQQQTPEDQKQEEDKTEEKAKERPKSTSTTKKKSSSSGGSSSGGSSTSSSSCALPKYPSASCTGVPAGTSLTVVNGDMTITAAGTIIEKKEIRGCISVNAPGVIIRKSKIIADCFYVVDRSAAGGTALLIEDSEISCDNNNGTGIGEEGVIVRRVNVHGCENGFDINSDFVVEDSYIHDLTQTGSDPHTDGIQINPNAHDVSILHNTIYAFTNGVNGTSAIIQPPTNMTDISIKNNLVAGGAYTIYCRATGSYSNTWEMRDNHFSTINGPNVGEYGPMTDCQDEPNVSGNVYHETGQPVPLS